MVSFVSPSKGRLTLAQLVEEIQRYVGEDAEAQHKMVIGSDSQIHGSQTLLVAAIVVHRVGKGARFFYTKKTLSGVSALRQRIYAETQFSMDLLEAVKSHGLLEVLQHCPVEVHLDVGQEGETRKLIQEVVGWVSSVGYTPKIKPFAYGATNVADRFTKSVAAQSV